MCGLLEISHDPLLPGTVGAFQAPVAAGQDLSSADSLPPTSSWAVGATWSGVPRSGHPPCFEREQWVWLTSDGRFHRIGQRPCRGNWPRGWVSWGRQL